MHSECKTANIHKISLTQGYQEQVHHPQEEVGHREEEIRNRWRGAAAPSPRELMGAFQPRRGASGLEAGPKPVSFCTLGRPVGPPLSPQIPCWLFFAGILEGVSQSPEDQTLPWLKKKKNAKKIKEDHNIVKRKK